MENLTLDAAPAVSNIMEDIIMAYTAHVVKTVGLQTITVPEFRSNRYRDCERYAKKRLKEAGVHRVIIYQWLPKYNAYTHVTEF